MGCNPYKPTRDLTIQDREVTDPVLCGDFSLDGYVKAGLIDDTMPDIREAAKKNKEEGIIGETGAEAFFCDTMQCVKKKDEVLTLCGMENHDDVIEEHISELCEEYKEMHEAIRTKQKRIERHEKLLEALAVKLNYDHISFSPDGVMMVKDGVTYHYPPKRRPYCESWDR